MKKFTIPCDFGGKKAPFDVYIGMPKGGNHPLQNQAHWLASERGGTIPSEVMESFSKLLALSEKNGVSFEDLCVYALEAANEEKKKMAQPAAAAPAKSAPPPQPQQPTQPKSPPPSDSGEEGSNSGGNNNSDAPKSFSLGSVNLTEGNDNKG